MFESKNSNMTRFTNKVTNVLLIQTVEAVLRQARA